MIYALSSNIHLGCYNNAYEKRRAKKMKVITFWSAKNSFETPGKPKKKSL